jgi:demethylmenaquinone methyltransferase / 2-methoxy-6-polyprenyl-1,4-benzoquinol methylase
MLASASPRYEVPAMPAADFQESEARLARLAAVGNGEKRGYVKAMFSNIAPRYDLLNHLLSFNVDRRWRRRAIQALGWERQPEGLYLDLCAGTLDVANALSRQPGFAGSIIGADFAEPMLRAGRDKVQQRRVHPVTSDALALPLSDGACAGAIVAFGLRNLADLDAGIREVARVLRPGSRFVVLEFSTPRHPIVRWGYHLYFHHILPLIGGIISGNATAYRYLPQSVANFPVVAEVAERMRRAGFRDVSWQSLTFGVAAMHVGTRAE